MKLEEAIKILEYWRMTILANSENGDRIAQAIKTALHYIKEESIPRAVLKEKKNELDNEIKEYNEWRKRGQETDVEYYTNIGNEVARDILQEILAKGE